jgi:hypothetical protein
MKGPWGFSGNGGENVRLALAMRAYLAQPFLRSGNGAPHLEKTKSSLIKAKYCFDRRSDIGKALGQAFKENKQNNRSIYLHRRDRLRQRRTTSTLENR